MQKHAVFSFVFAISLISAACSPVQQSSDSKASSQQASTVVSPLPTDIDVPGDTGAALSCTNAAQQSRFDTFLAQQLKWYEARTSYLPVAKVRSIFVPGTNGHAIVIVHGYNSSPHNQRDMIINLAGKGFTIIAPLLTGFGSEASVANLATMSEWRKTVDDAVALVAPCHQKVSLLGHSFGGTLVTEAVQSGRLTNIAKIVSLAPFYRPSTSLLTTAVNQVAAQYPTVSAAALTGITQLDSYEFFPISDVDAGEPVPALPMIALQKVFASQSLFTNLTGAKSSVPIFLGISRGDLVIDNTYATSYVQARFTNTFGISYPASDGIGHSFQRDDNNPKFADMMAKIATFLVN